MMLCIDPKGVNRTVISKTQIMFFKNFSDEKVFFYFRGASLHYDYGLRANDQP